MTEENLTDWLREVLSSLADAFHGDLAEARRIVMEASADAHPDLRDVARQLDDRIVAEMARRERAARLAGIVHEKRIELNGTTPPGIPSRYHQWIAKIQRGLERLEAGGGSEESAANVARGIEVDLQLMREQARRPRRGHTKGESDPAIRGWLKRYLAALTLRFFEAKR